MGQIHIRKLQHAHCKTLRYFILDLILEHMYDLIVITVAFKPAQQSSHAMQIFSCLQTVKTITEFPKK